MKNYNSFSQEYKIQNSLGFTLVELIVVITILAILGTIGFISIGGQSATARDSSRLSSLKMIEGGLGIFRAQGGSYPMPENPITILSNNSPIGYQGYYGETANRVAKLDKVPLDPLDNIQYTYSVNSGGSRYQVGAYFENSTTSMVDPFIEPVYAIDYKNRQLRTKGDSIGILLSGTGGSINTPLHTYYDAASFTGVDVTTFTNATIGGETIDTIKAVFSEKSSISGTGSTLGQLSGLYRGKIQIATHVSTSGSGCPSGWKNIGDAMLGSNPVRSLGINLPICEKDDSSLLPPGSVVAMTVSTAVSACPDGWEGSSAVVVASNPVRIYNGVSLSNFRSCTVPISNPVFPKDSIVIMNGCPKGWTYQGQVRVGTNPVKVNGIDLLACSKNE